MIAERHTEIAGTIIRAIHAEHEAPSVQAIVISQRSVETDCFVCPSWEDLATGEVTASSEEDEDSNQPRAGWQSKARKVRPGTSHVCWVEETDFGQSRFGHPDLANFSQQPILASPILASPILANPILDLVCVSWWGPNPAPKVRASNGGVLKGRGVGPKPRKNRAPKGGRRGATFRVFFSPAPFSLFLSPSGSLLVEFWWCLKRRDPRMCTFGALGLSCETPVAPTTHKNNTTTTHNNGLFNIGLAKVGHNLVRQPPGCAQSFVAGTKWTSRFSSVRQSACQQIGCRALIRSLSGCSSCAVSVKPYPSLFAHADVAVSLVALATIGLRVQLRGCWVVVGFHWRTWQHEFVEN